MQLPPLLRGPAVRPSPGDGRRARRDVGTGAFRETVDPATFFPSLCDTFHLVSMLMQPEYVLEPVSLPDTVAPTRRGLNDVPMRPKWDDQDDHLGPECPLQRQQNGFVTRSSGRNAMDSGPCASPTPASTSLRAN